MSKKRKEPVLKEMKCAVCEKCYENPNSPGRCHYGGPYIGYARVTYK